MHLNLVSSNFFENLESYIVGQKALRIGTKRHKPRNGNHIRVNIIHTFAEA
jgi:hypothetical protein